MYGKYLWLLHFFTGVPVSTVYICSVLFWDQRIIRLSLSSHYLSLSTMIFWVRCTWVCFIYIPDSSNYSSFKFWTGQFTSSSTGNSNGTWNDKHSSHFSTAKEIRVKAIFFFSCNNHNKQILKWCWNPLVIFKWWAD